MTVTLQAGSGPQPEQAAADLRDCGPQGCDLDWLSSARIETEVDDVAAFSQFALEQGWGDGMPLIPPTEARVRDFLGNGNRYADELICTLPPQGGECTVEKIAINAVMAGARAESLPLIIAALEAMAHPDFELFGQNTTTAPVYPVTIVNGPIRDRLDIPYGHGCLGGAATQAAAIGRAIRLIMRNIAGQVPGITSQTTFGSPGRVAGVVFGEWEERSPWAPFAERRGVKGDAVSVYGTMGTMNVLDTVSQKGHEFVEMIGKSLAYPGANGLTPCMPFAEILLAINPVWAQIIHRDIPALEDVQQMLWERTAMDAGHLTARHREQLESLGRVSNGKVYVVTEPRDVMIVCCGGGGGLHATGFHSFGSSLTQTVAIKSGPDNTQEKT